jgi:hypothetical protein
MVIGGGEWPRPVARRGIEEVSVWVWSLVLGYASLLLVAALWAIVERTRSANRERKRRLPEPAAHRVVAADRLASEGNAPTNPARA